MVIHRILLTCTLFLAAPMAWAEDISGYWKHSEAPGWIQVSLEEGKGTVIRNDEYPERVGREVLRGLEADGAEANRWHGEIYAERFGEYRKVEISLPEPDRMEFKVKIGFIKRTIEWVRVDEVPPAPAE